jgi:carboxymethylenebutenolidase
MRIRFLLIGPALLWSISACAPAPRAAEMVDHDHGPEGDTAASVGTDLGSLPASSTGAAARIAASPRHAEWAMIDAGDGDSVRVWLVYPERSDRAPVVLVVHEIFGLSTWIRGVADQLAADGFIAAAPDLLSGANVPEVDGQPDPEVARVAIRTLQPADVQRRLSAVAAWATNLPAALPGHGIVGFCWGGTVAFEHAASDPSLGASVVYYGTSPAEGTLQRVSAPVLGLYGENDARVNATIEPARTFLSASGKTFDHEIYAGAGHGFLRAQDAQEGANQAATRQAWPRTLDWFRRHLEQPR